jgi:HD superfamily phosphohydrolase
MVYPGANYSRFAHSLGACHIAGRMVKAINLNCLAGQRRNEDELQKYRLAALLHDVGHYPFSHAMEHVVQDHYKGLAYLQQPAANTAMAQGAEAQPAESAVSASGGDTSQAQNSDDTPTQAAEGGAARSDDPAAFGHELLGRKLIDEDAEIGAVLDRHGISRADLKAAFSRETPGSLVSLVSSDLDCDRLDYLMRSARHAGMPYGGVDVDYIVAQTSLDRDDRVCLTRKAMRAADHVLVARYFDYTQIVFHKTVVALEECLKDVIKGLLSTGRLDCSAQTISRMIVDGSFARFDDFFLIDRLRDTATELAATPDDPLLIKINAVLDRKGPKLVLASEYIDERDLGQKQAHKNLVDQVRDKIPQLIEEFGIPRELWHLWQTSLPLTKVGSHIPYSEVEEGGGDYEEESQQTVRILSLGNDRTSRPLNEIESALMRQLSNYRFYAIRLYVHLIGAPDEVQTKRNQIQDRIRSGLPNFPFQS